jgi:hypothetical protein
MTHSDFLVWLADEIFLSRPHDSARLLEIANDHRRLTEFADEQVNEAIAKANRALAVIEQRTAAE